MSRRSRAKITCYQTPCVCQSAAWASGGPWDMNAIRENALRRLHGFEAANLPPLDGAGSMTWSHPGPSRGRELRHDVCQLCVDRRSRASPSHHVARHRFRGAAGSAAVRDAASATGLRREVRRLQRRHGASGELGRDGGMMLGNSSRWPPGPFRSWCLAWVVCPSPWILMKPSAADASYWSPAS